MIRAGSQCHETKAMKKLALIGGRGYTGAELLGLLARHGGLELAFASSGSQAGTAIQAVCSAWPNATDQFVALAQEEVVRRHADVWVLAVPNGVAREWALAIRAAHPLAVILDLSADHRFDPAWTYGLPERFRSELKTARLIANPGCYATGMQLGLLPLVGELAGPPVVFGVSGYSGAGKKPSPNNDPERLRDNLVPYKLAGHVHEREVSFQLDHEVRFMPHVASFFRGISLTLSLRLQSPVEVAEVAEQYRQFYTNEPLVRVQDAIPEVREVQGAPYCLIGGFTVDARDARRVCLVVVLDNLLKGAASQALQNINLALGLDEHEGVSQ